MRWISRPQNVLSVRLHFSFTVASAIAAFAMIRSSPLILPPLPDLLRLGIAAVVIAGALSAGCAGQQPEADEGPVAVDELRHGLMEALGDKFEYLDGEVGRTQTRVGGWSAERFWFAKVRPKAAGEFAVSYAITFDWPDKASPNKALMPERAVYVLPIKIGECGAPRVIQAGAWGGSAYPHANVADTLIIPIHVDRYRVGHRFETLTTEHSSVRSFFRVASEREHEQFLKRAAAEPVVRNEAADWLDLLASWGMSFGNRPGTAMSHSLTAYLEFKKLGEFNLVGGLAEPNADTGEGTSLRVVPKDQPVTVLLEYFYYGEHAGGEHAGQRTVSKSGAVGSGTIEARVGDRVVVGCGDYSTPGLEELEQVQYRPGVVVVRPLGAVEPYTPEQEK